MASPDVAPCLDAPRPQRNRTLPARPPAPRRTNRSAMRQGLPPASPATRSARSRKGARKLTPIGSSVSLRRFARTVLRSWPSPRGSSRGHKPPRRRRQATEVRFRRSSRPAGGRKRQPMSSTSRPGPNHLLRVVGQCLPLTSASAAAPGQAGSALAPGQETMSAAMSSIESASSSEVRTSLADACGAIGVLGSTLAPTPPSPTRSCQSCLWAGRAPDGACPTTGRPAPVVQHGQILSHPGSSVIGQQGRPTRTVGTAVPRATAPSGSVIDSSTVSANSHTKTNPNATAQAGRRPCSRSSIQPNHSLRFRHSTPSPADSSRRYPRPPSSTKWCSEVQTEWKRSRSARAAASRKSR